MSKDSLGEVGHVLAFLARSVGKQAKSLRYSRLQACATGYLPTKGLAGK